VANFGQQGPFFKFSGQKGEKKDKGQGRILVQRQTVLYLGQTAHGLLPE